MRTCTIMCVGLAGIATAIPANAQPTSNDAASIESGEILVTARRRSEEISRTPVSVIAFDADDLYRRSIVRASDLQAYTPGLQIGYTGLQTSPSIALRGQRRTSIGEGAPSVLIYQNEVPLPTLGSLIPTYDVSSIQVLKGPQGTLFGRNATAGAVLIYSALPTGEIEGYADVRVGEYDTREFEGALNLPIIGDRLAVRVAGQIARRDAFTDNQGTGPDLDDRHDDSFRVSLLAQPTDALRNVTVFDYFRARNAGGSPVLYGLYPNATAGGGNARIAALAPFFDCNTSIACDIDLQLAQQRQNGPRDVFVNTPSFSEVDVRGVSNTTTYTIGDALTLKNIFGYRSVSSNALSDLDGTPLRLVESRSFSKSEQLTDELQASGKALADRLNWVVGAFYLEDRPNGIGGAATAILTPRSGPPAVTAQAYRRARSKAAYAQVGYELGSWLPGVTVNAGIRRTIDKQKVCSISTPTSSPLIDNDACRQQGQTLSATFKATTWTLGVDWQVSRELFLYATSRRGYRAGGINTPLLGGQLSPLQSYAPETTTDIEIGAKFNGRVGNVPFRLSGDLYRGKYKGIQRNYTLPPNADGDGIAANDPTSGIVLNSGEAILQGAEFELNVRPIADFELTAGGAYTDAHYKRITVNAILDRFGLIPANAVDNKFPLTPSWTYNVGAGYSPSLGSLGRLLLRIDYYHSDRFWLNDRPAADVAVRVPGYDLVNARIGLSEIGGSGLDASLFVNNAFDKNYVVGSGNFAPALSFVSAFYGPPRLFGAELRYRF